MRAATTSCVALLLLSCGPARCAPLFCCPPSFLNRLAHLPRTHPPLYHHRLGAGGAKAKIGGSAHQQRIAAVLKKAGFWVEMEGGALKSPAGRALPVDIVVKLEDGRELYLEVDDLSHFQPVVHYGASYSNNEHVRARDVFKMFAASEAGISTCRLTNSFVKSLDDTALLAALKAAFKSAETEGSVFLCTKAEAGCYDDHKAALRPGSGEPVYPEPAAPAASVAEGSRAELLQRALNVLRADPESWGKLDAALRAAAAVKGADGSTTGAQLAGVLERMFSVLTEQLGAGDAAGFTVDQLEQLAGFKSPHVAAAQLEFLRTLDQQRAVINSSKCAAGANVVGTPGTNHNALQMALMHTSGALHLDLTARLLECLRDYLVGFGSCLALGTVEKALYRLFLGHLVRGAVDIFPGGVTLTQAQSDVDVQPIVDRLRREGDERMRSRLNPTGYRLPHYRYVFAAGDQLRYGRTNNVLCYLVAAVAQPGAAGGAVSPAEPPALVDLRPVHHLEGASPEFVILATEFMTALDQPAAAFQRPGNSELGVRAMFLSVQEMQRPGIAAQITAELARLIGLWHAFTAEERRRAGERQLERGHRAGSASAHAPRAAQPSLPLRALPHPNRRPPPGNNSAANQGRDYFDVIGVLPAELKGMSKEDIDTAARQLFGQVHFFKQGELRDSEQQPEPCARTRLDAQTTPHVH